MLLALRAGGGSALQNVSPAEYGPKTQRMPNTSAALGFASAKTIASPATGHYFATRGLGDGAAAETHVRLTDQTLSCAARAHVATAERHAACLHLKRAMQAA